MDKSVYVGNALSGGTPIEFISKTDDVRRLLREAGWNVLEYLGTKNGTCRDVWRKDMHGCVGGCHVLLAIADYASTGLGIEIGLMIGRHEGPVLIVASRDRVEMENPRVVTRAIQDPDEKYVRFQTYESHTEIPDMLRRFVEEIERSGYVFPELCESSEVSN